MTTKNLALGLMAAGLIGLTTACTKTEVCDTAAGEDCGTLEEADADADADSDTDADGDADSYFEPYAVAFFVDFGWDGSAIVPIYSDGTEVAPNVGMAFVEEAYFDTGDTRYRCDYYWELVEGDPNNFGGEVLWGTETSYVDAYAEVADANGWCSGFDPDVWGESGTPGAWVAENYVMGISYAEMSDDDKQAYADARGEEWDADKDYVLGGGLAFQQEGEWSWTGSGSEAYAYELDADYELVYEADDTLSRYLAQDIVADGEIGGQTRMFSVHGWYYSWVVNE
jgi:hypothetical protein